MCRLIISSNCLSVSSVGSFGEEPEVEGDGDGAGEGEGEGEGAGAGAGAGAGEGAGEEVDFEGLEILTGAEEEEGGCDEEKPFIMFDVGSRI